MVRHKQTFKTCTHTLPLNSLGTPQQVFMSRVTARQAKRKLDSKENSPVGLAAACSNPTSRKRCSSSRLLCKTEHDHHDSGSDSGSTDGYGSDDSDASLDSAGSQSHNSEIAATWSSSSSASSPFPSMVSAKSSVPPPALPCVAAPKNQSKRRKPTAALDVPPHEMTEEQRREDRARRNRASALKSRNKRQQRLAFLEVECKRLCDRIRLLEGENVALQAENAALRHTVGSHNVDAGAKAGASNTSATAAAAAASRRRVAVPVKADVAPAASSTTPPSAATPARSVSAAAPLAPATTTTTGCGGGGSSPRSTTATATLGARPSQLALKAEPAPFAAIATTTTPGVPAASAACKEEVESPSVESLVDESDVSGGLDDLLDFCFSSSDLAFAAGVSGAWSAEDDAILDVDLPLSGATAAAAAAAVASVDLGPASCAAASLFGASAVSPLKRLELMVSL
jgi:hypothetical protein